MRVRRLSSLCNGLASVCALLCRLPRLHAIPRGGGVISLPMNDISTSSISLPSSHDDRQADSEPEISWHLVDVNTSIVTRVDVVAARRYYRRIGNGAGCHGR